MQRFSVSAQLIPDTARPGEFVLHAGYSVWEGDRCLRHQSVVDHRLHDVPEPGTGSTTVIHFMMEMLDLAYQEVSAVLGKEGSSIRKTDARSGEA